jgi:hypothetical protein
MRKAKAKTFFRTPATTREKINVTSLVLALSQISKDPDLQAMSVRMVESLYSKSQDRAFRRADALLAVLNSHT